MGSSAINPVDAKFCIFNRWSISQAGRRGFDPRPPLHPWNASRKRVEIPAIAEMIESTLARMREFSQQNGLNVSA
jgi:hypothetical protein